MNVVEQAVEAAREELCKRFMKALETELRGLGGMDEPRRNAWGQAYDAHNVALLAEHWVERGKDTSWFQAFSEWVQDLYGKDYGRPRSNEVRSVNCAEELHWFKTIQRAKPLLDDVVLAALDGLWLAGQDRANACLYLFNNNPGPVFDRRWVTAHDRARFAINKVWPWHVERLHIVTEETQS